MKSQIFNLIILDESGSMSGVARSTISGCNETLNSIRSAQKAFADTQEHLVSIYVFQQNDHVPSRYLIKNQPIDSVSDINAEQYKPWGCTPLYDAIGATLTDMKAKMYGLENAVGVVTIITDGLENASKRYTHHQVAKMIDALKEMGWSFNFIGANIDVEATARSLNIDSALEFDQSAEGTTAMFERESLSRMKWAERYDAIMREEEALCASNPTSAAERRKSRFERLKDSAKKYFNPDDDQV